MLFQYYPNYLMITIEALFSLIILYFIARVANKTILKEDQITLKNKNRSITFSLLSSLGVILAIRYILAYLGYFSEQIIILNNLYFGFAVMSSSLYLFLKVFIKKYEVNHSSDRNRSNNIKFLKRGILIVGVSWVNAFIFLSIELLGIPLGDFIPSDLLNPSYDVFLLGFEWAFFIILINTGLTMIINRFYPIDKRLSKDVINNSMTFSGLISFGIWAIQLIVVELYLARLFNIDLYEQDLRILTLTVTSLYILSFYLSLKKSLKRDLALGLTNVHSYYCTNNI